MEAEKPQWTTEHCVQFAMIMLSTPPVPDRELGWFFVSMPSYIKAAKADKNRLFDKIDPVKASAEYPDEFSSAVADLIERAFAGQKNADKILRKAADCFLAAGSPLPQVLAEYIRKILNDQGPKLGPGREKNEARDINIVFTVLHVSRHGWRPRRSSARTSTHSAYSIIASI